jgi:hypothetical protein
MRITHAAVAAVLAGAVGAWVGVTNQPAEHATSPLIGQHSVPGDEPVRPVSSFSLSPWPLAYPTRYYICWDQMDHATGQREMVYGMPHQMPDYGPNGYLYTTELIPCLKKQGKLPEDYPLTVSGH